MLSSSELASVTFEHVSNLLLESSHLRQLSRDQPVLSVKAPCFHDIMLKAGQHTSPSAQTSLWAPAVAAAAWLLQQVHHLLLLLPPLLVAALLLCASSPCDSQPHHQPAAAQATTQQHNLINPKP